VGIVRHYQFLNSTDLLADELAQLDGAVALSGGDSAAQEGNGQGAGHLFQEPMAIDRLRRRRVSLWIPGFCKLHFRFIIHVSCTSRG
jgi:hypothetical protein